MRTRRPALLRLVAAALAAAAVCIALPAAAAAHSALESSDPAADSSVPTSPRQIVLTFSEAPDVKLSLVRVLDGSGAVVPGVSAPQAVPGDEQSLQVTPSTPLPDGTYTVNWRAVSAVDGHVDSGAFAFGVGQAAGEAVVVDLLHTSPWAQALADAGRWLLYAALVVLIGAASTSLLVYGGRLPPGGVLVLRDRCRRRRGRPRHAGLGGEGARRRAQPPAAVPHPGGQVPARAGRRSAAVRRRRRPRRPLARSLESLGARGDGRRRRPGPRARRARRLTVFGVAAQRRRAVGAHGRGRRLGRRAALAAARSARP